LGVFHGGVSLVVLGMMLEADPEAVIKLAVSLIEVGLAEHVDYGHLRLDPALPSYLLGQMSDAEQERFRSHWAEGMQALTGFLFRQHFQDAQLAAQLTLLDLPNLLALLAWAQYRLTPEEVVELAGNVETLLAPLSRPHALAQAVKVREQAAQRLGEWNHAQFEAERMSIERLLEQGDPQAARTVAQQLLQHCLDAGEEAYPEAAYDIALAHLMFGRVLRIIGTAGAALKHMGKARQRFRTLAEAGSTNAEYMASAAITENGDCLRDLGRLDEAAASYEEAIKCAEKLDHKRQIAVTKAQLSTALMLQKRYAEALQVCTEVRDIFESLGEPGSVAGAWHHIGIVHRGSGQFEQAERAYRQALAIFIQQKNLAGEARSLNELGNLYDEMERAEEAVTVHRQAADIYVKLHNLNREGLARTNLAATLIKLQRYDEARYELHRAIECKEPFDHAAQPWKTWAFLYNLERATGHPLAAIKALLRTMWSYLAYRRAGGESIQSSRTLRAGQPGHSAGRDDRGRQLPR